MNNPKPTISVILPVHNGARYIRSAVKSILTQTHRDFELIIINDGSDDATLKIVVRMSQRDPRIIVHTLPDPVGISRALNYGISYARGKYLARMDADDIAHPQRLSLQKAYLEKNRHVVVVGSQCVVITARGKKIGTKQFPLSHSDIYHAVQQFNPVQHPTIMINHRLLPKGMKLYDHLDGAEDLQLLFKVFPYGEVHNMPEYLHSYRIHGENVSLKHIKSIFRQTLIARYRGVTRFGYKPTIWGVFITFIQSVIVSALPERLIKLMYMKTRGVPHDMQKSMNVKPVVRLSHSI